ncbi:WUSCHEL-related homeobox 8-like, partial [Olea europaea subsp. europaea]
MGRQERWITTSTEVDFLRCIFDGGNKNPNNAETLHIVSTLSPHNPIISAKNVGDWFKNRRSCERKRKQTCIENPQLKNLMHEVQPHSTLHYDRRLRTFGLTGLYSAYVFFLCLYLF